MNKTMSVFESSTNNSSRIGDSNNSSGSDSGFDNIVQLPIIGLFSKPYQFIIVFSIIILFLSMGFGSLWLYKNSQINKAESASYLSSIYALLVQQKGLVESFPGVGNVWTENINSNQEEISILFNNINTNDDLINQKKSELSSLYQQTYSTVENLQEYAATSSEINSILNNSINRMNDLGGVLSQYAEQNTVLRNYHKNLEMSLRDYYDHPILSSRQINFISANLLQELSQVVGQDSDILSAYASLRSNNFQKLSQASDTISGIVNKKQQAIDSLKEAASKAKQVNQAVYDNSASNTSFIIYTFIAFCLIFAILMIYVLGLIYKVAYENLRHLVKSKDNMMKKSIKLLSEEVKNIINKSNFNKRATDPGTEIDTFVNDFNNYIKNFQIKIADIKKNVKELDKEVSDVNDMNEEYILLVRNQIDSTLSIIEAVFELSTGMSRVFEEAEGILELSNSSKKMSLESFEQAKTFNENIRSASENLKESQERVLKFENSVLKTRDVLDMMKDFVEEINILSINSSLQASKSGGAGSDFDFVAKAMQDLAKRSAHETEKAAVFVNNTIQNAESVKESVDVSVKSVDSSASAALSVQEKIEEVKENSLLISQKSKNLIKESTEYSQKSKKLREDAENFKQNIENNQNVSQKIKEKSVEASKKSSDLFEKAKNIRA